MLDSHRVHSRFAPSSLKRVLMCPPSVILSEARTAPPSLPSYYAAEGTVAHELAEARLRGETGFELDSTVIVPPHEILVTDEMWLAATVFAEYIKGLAHEETTLWIEQTVRLDDYVGRDAHMPEGDERIVGGPPGAPE